jgi:chorismate mutase/prephenate dehydratase
MEPSSNQGENHSGESRSSAGKGSDIETLREVIDRVDEKILALINRRLLLAKHIGDLKRGQGQKVMDKARESMVINRLASMNPGPLSDKALRHFFTEIIAASREAQRPHQVTYLGPEATFTHIAAMNHFGSAVAFVPQPTIKDIFNEVEKERCQYGVVPVENSIEGAVNYTLDLFYESELKICAEIYLPISHDLLSGAEEVSEIKVIYSHPHAFAQCRKWLRKHLPNCPLEECSSTAAAAHMASGQPGAGAIASRMAAHMYGLKIVASRIEDISRNITRFLVIGRDDIRRTGKDKTSIMFVTTHVPGALYKVLKPIADAGINMVKLESRPAKLENWSYIFFVDFEGHIEETVVQETLEEMRPKCLFLKWLGSYPRSYSG